jgi:serine protease Do
MTPRVSIALLLLFALAPFAGAKERPEDPLVKSAPPLAITPDDPSIDTRFNLKRLPENDSDLLQIQTAMDKSLGRSLKALVCIEMGGGSGSGVIVTPNGLILSAAHVVMEPGKELDIILPGGKKVKGETLGLVPETDAGMARIIDEGTYDHVPLGDYASLKLGHWCYALGHSGGWDEKRGPVVRIGRIIRLKDGTMQSDCKLIGGDSGGPIFDMQGRLIGINSRVGSNVEESLHCPTDVYIREDVPLRKGIVVGQEKPAFFGVTTVENDGKGVLVTKVLEDGPADRAGLKEKDAIVSVFGEPIADKAAFSAIIGELKAGERIPIRVRRADGKEEDLWMRSTSRDGFDVMGT